MQGFAVGKVEALAVQALVERAANLRVGEATLKNIIAERYQESLNGLIKDLRRFGAINAVAFALMIDWLFLRAFFTRLVGSGRLAPSWCYSIQWFCR